MKVQLRRSLPSSSTLDSVTSSAGNTTSSALLKAALMAVLSEDGNFSSQEDNAPRLLAAALTEQIRQQGDNDEPHRGLRAILGDVLIASNTAWTRPTLDLVDEIWRYESKSILTVDAGSIPAVRRYGGVDLALWRGDITTLASPSPKRGNGDGNGNGLAIVNAANDQALGCFVPDHRCIDNVIHRRAGPGLRMECRDVITETGRRDSGPPLSAGTVPIVTSAYHLPCHNVIHVTGPQIAVSSPSCSSRPVVVGRDDRALLAATYRNVLDAASALPEIRMVAFPCISTGLFGFPQDQAADVALTAVRDWIDDFATHQRDGGDDGDGDGSPTTGLDRIIFNVFTDTDLALYRQRLVPTFSAAKNRHEYVTDGVDGHVIKADAAVLPPPSRSGPTTTTTTNSVRTKMLDLARVWIDDADAVLICAGAGMSVKEGEMVYTSPADFARHYPWFVANNRWGYRTSYETMGLASDPSVPSTAKWALYAKHMDNMRWTFTPNSGYYDLLHKLVRDDKKDYFVLTSNVDACFERSGFDPRRIYTPQGEWTYLQCTRPCSTDAVYEARPYLDAILPHISNDTGLIPERLVPSCPRCGSELFGNVRGGNWFLHHERWERQNAALQEWMERYATGDRKNRKVVVLEIGAGFNTPTVTRFPIEAFVRELGGRDSDGREGDGPGSRRAALIRINPSDGVVPEDLKAMSLLDGWQVLAEIAGRTGLATTAATVDGSSDDGAVAPTVPTDASSLRSLEKEVREHMGENGLLQPNHVTGQIMRRFGGRMDWRDFLNQLRSRPA